MNKIKRLTQSYSKYISVPWRSDAAAASFFVCIMKRKNAGSGQK